MLRSLIRRLGFDVVRYPQSRPTLVAPVAASTSQLEKWILNAVAPYTMTSPERLLAMMDAVRHVDRLKIPGCIVECGVWRGGSMMAAALSIGGYRNIHLYDTFTGMTPPTDVDRTQDGRLASEHLADNEHYRCIATLDDVKKNMASTQYPAENIHYHVGPVEETIPRELPAEPIAVLRLDTDWYESTRHELTHLFPLLCPGGILIIDDYGHWQGAQKAVDEYFAGSQYFLHRIDYTGRLLVKTPVESSARTAPV